MYPTWTKKTKSKKKIKFSNKEGTHCFGEGGYVEERNTWGVFNQTAIERMKPNLLKAKKSSVSKKGTKFNSLDKKTTSYFANTLLREIYIYAGVPRSYYLYKTNTYQDDCPLVMYYNRFKVIILSPVRAPE